MLSSLSTSKPFRKNRESQSSYSLYPSSPVTKDSKAQHILGLSRAELNSARTLSLSPKAKPVVRSKAQRQNSVQIPFMSSQKKFPVVSVSSELDPNQSPILLHEDPVRTPETASISEPTSNTDSIRSPSPVSTRISQYDAVQAPPKFSQRNLNLSTHDPTLQRGSSAILAPRDSAEDQTRQLRMFARSSSTPPRMERMGSGRATSSLKQNVRFQEVSPQSSLLQPQPEADLTGTQVSLPLTVSAPAEHSFMAANRSMLNAGRNKPTNRSQDKPLATNTINMTLHTPYAKINVRRPKAGTKHWFDNLDDDLSEEEENNEPELQPQFVTEVEQAFSSGRIHAMSRPEDTEKEAIMQPPPGKRSRDPSISLPSARSTTPSQCTVKPALTEKTSTSAKRTNKKINPFKRADLTQESVLYLSTSSDDEEDKKRPASLIRALRSPEIRESLAIDTMDDSEIEIGLAHAIKTHSEMARNRPTQIQFVNVKDSGSPASTRTASAASMSVCASDDDGTTFRRSTTTPPKDIDEDDILSSFPPTPVDTNMSRKASVQSSIYLSDDASMASTRLMKVTRQEENLLAAMRLKKAAMKRAEKERVRKGALKILDTSEKMVVTGQEGRQQVDNHLRLDSPFSPRHEHPRPRSRRQDHMDHARRHTRESVTTFQTDAYSIRDLDAACSPDSYDQPQHVEKSPQAPSQPQGRFVNYPPSKISKAHHQHSHSHAHSLSQSSTRPETFLSSASENSEARDGGVVVLDHHDPTLRAEGIPSQLFMESPFVGWERAELAAR